MSRAQASAAFGEGWDIASEELALLDGAGSALDVERFGAQEQTPVFFGSALKNYGLDMLLDALASIVPAPVPRSDRSGSPRPIDGTFAGFVFKVQTNMDPLHRDRIAFLRVCSGRLERGMMITHAETGRRFATSYARGIFGRERIAVEEAFAGDVIGIVNAQGVRAGDTLHDGASVTFPALPRFAPEHFTLLRSTDVARYKQFRHAVRQLDEEGVVQVLRRPHDGEQVAVLAAVGAMQFEIAAWRLESEFGVPTTMEPLEYTIAMRTDDAGARWLTERRQAAILAASDGTIVAAFPDRYRLDRIRRDEPQIVLEPFAGSDSPTPGVPARDRQTRGETGGKFQDSDLRIL